MPAGQSRHSDASASVQAPDLLVCNQVGVLRAAAGAHQALVQAILDAGVLPLRADSASQQHVAVAYSGGRDSTALLHLVARLAQACGGLQVHALHVHHGLSPHADAWWVHTQDCCARWQEQGLPVSWLGRRVDLGHPDPFMPDAHAAARVHIPGRGPELGNREARARAARYAALHEMLVETGAELLLLAHHRRDQAETFLLQALRGASVAGLAAMPKCQQRQGRNWIRPWLEQPRSAIEDYLRVQQLGHVEDDSNLDLSLARNRLRHEVWPALERAFPQAEQAMSASTHKLADVLETLQAWQQAQAWTSGPTTPLQDRGVPRSLPRVDPKGVAAPTWPLSQWLTWPPGLRRESLRHWVHQVSGRGLSASWVVRLERELLEACAGGPGELGPQAPHARGSKVRQWPQLGLAVYRQTLCVVRQLPLPQAQQWGAAAGRPKQSQRQPLTDLRLGLWPLPQWGGVLEVRACQLAGVDARRLAQVWVAPRGGAEQFQLGPARPARSLKKQYQAKGVPVWLRQTPLFWSGEQLLMVPGLGMDARLWAPEGTPQYELVWHQAGLRSQGGAV